jgi:hypothetical protein
MTTEEMTAKIVKFVEGHRGASLFELVRYLGEDAKGDLTLHFPNRPNTILWTDVSEMFVLALVEAEKQGVTTRGTNPLIYYFDGGALRLPLAKRVKGADYKHERWLPVELNIAVARV